MTPRTLLTLALWGHLATALIGCDAEPATIPDRDGTDADTLADTAPDTVADTGPVDTGPHDSADPDTALDTRADTTPEVLEPDPMKTHRVIGGMSMGAMSLTIALERPYTFDLVGALGGYPDMTYMMAQMLRLHFAGFCDLPTLASALPDLDQVSGCPAPTPRSELEFPQSFNHLHYDDNGITMSRGFYADIIDNFSSAFGNLSTLEHAQSPLHPAGLDLDWLHATPSWERCQQNRPLDPAASFSLETNPDGLYRVYPLCDQSRPTAPDLAPSEFDPDAPRTTPVAGLAFVDLDGDGVRHSEEPLFLNPWERFKDVGPDGCESAYEDGLGGCLETPDATSSDPNGDDYHWRDNPTGLEQSEALNARRGFTVLVPPSYDAPENAERRYPVIYFLHGLGQDASDLAAVGLATSVLMSQGTLPHVLLVFPDGACCFVDRETGARECACSDAEQGLRTCVDPTCTGPEATCEKRQIPDQNLERECHRGSLYADMRSDRWGEPRTNMGYKTSVHELVDHVDRTYRTRATRPAGVPPPSGRPAR